jgi:phage N-6-adenine-methyltransferase
VNIETPNPPKTGASNNRFRSKQTYETPWQFIRAVEDRFGKIIVDLAASKENCRALRYFTEEHDSIQCNWAELKDGLLWLNPPFSQIAPWAQKCSVEAAKGARIAFLTPASVDSNWWKNYVHGQAWVEFISPRIQFDGADDPFPKPLALSLFNVCGVGYGCWRWKL